MPVDNIKKRTLHKTAHHLDPTVWVGKNGIPIDNIQKKNSSPGCTSFRSDSLGRKKWNNGKCH